MRLEIIYPPITPQKKGWMDISKEVAQKHGCHYQGADPEMNSMIVSTKRGCFPFLIARNITHVWFSVSPLEAHVVTELGGIMAREIQEALDNE